MKTERVRLSKEKEERMKMDGRQGERDTKRGQDWGWKRQREK